MTSQFGPVTLTMASNTSLLGSEMFLVFIALDIILLQGCER